jgi:hypothetical protein
MAQLNQNPTGNHQTFQAALSASKLAVEKIAVFLCSRGFEVEIPETQVAPSAAQWQQYADNGDLFIIREDGSKDRCEVKHLRSTWTCSKEFPHPNVIIYGRAAFDRAGKDGTLPIKNIILVNKPMTHYAACDVEHSRQWWIKRELPDKRYGPDYRQHFYLCPLSLLTFHKLEIRDDE